jgi:predicted DNA binding CopG/RHH family protein
MKKRIPEFSSESEEREFWATADSSEYMDWSKARRIVLPDLKPSLKTISLRLPEQLLAELKLLANKRDVPYQSLLKMFLAEKVRQELQAGESGKPRPKSSLGRTADRRR